MFPLTGIDDRSCSQYTKDLQKYRIGIIITAENWIETATFLHVMRCSMSNDITSVKQPEESTSVALTKGMEMMIAGFIPNTRYFDSRFDLLQVQVDLMQKGQSEVKSQIIRLEDQVERRFERSDEILKGFKCDVDKRSEQVDGRFSSLKTDMDKRFEKSDQNLNDFRTVVDKRFQQVDDKLDKILERIDRRIDEGLRENRVQSMRMFTFAMTFSAISMIGLVGKMMKLF